MNIQAALDRLFSLHQFGIKLGLDNIIHLLDQIGNPHQNLKTFHIAGSNGKGSTASFIASILMEAGFKVGLYTSPHFRIYNERIRVNGKMIDDEYVASFITTLDAYIQKNSPTFFELTTALAFKYFEEQKVDYAVIETGLGGRLDATNVIHPLASVITSISLEHTQHLGDTIEKIAAEKGGIIKPNSLILTGRMPAEAEKVISETASLAGSKYVSLNDYLRIERERILVASGEKRYSLYATPLRGAHQLINAAVALKTVEECLNLKKRLFYFSGMRNVLQNTGIEGRYEIVNSDPKIIFDSAHNPEGVAAFVEEFSKEYESYAGRTLIFGAMRDKSIEQMILMLKPYFDNIFVTKIDIDRSASPDELISSAEAAGVKVESLADPASYVNDFRNKPSNQCLVVLGSMYLLGEIKSRMFKEKA